MMESIILQQLKDEFPAPELQQAQLIKLVGGFGCLNDSEMKSTVADILCLAKLLYEESNREIMYDLRDQLTALERSHRENRLYSSKLEYLNKCLTNFKPAIFRSIQIYFSELYHVPPELVVCLPKITGQQVGTKVEIKRSPEDTNPIMFYVKTHQEFCSKSDPYYIAITSDGTGKVNFKELFIYKVLEYIGYGPKVHFIIDSDAAHSRVEEGILIATQDQGYTKTPHQKRKSFKTFREMKDELSERPIESIDETTRRDIIIIDMLSRAFLLEDVMVNQGNFGMVSSATLFEPPVSSSKWKIIDFIPPKLVKARGDDYSYGKHYPGGVSIFYSFRVGNISHTYDEEELEVINHILTEEHAQDLWLPALERLSRGAEHHLPIADAVERAFRDISGFMEENAGILRAKPGRMERRMVDLTAYKLKIMQNFTELERGAKEYTDAQRALVASQPE